LDIKKIKQQQQQRKKKEKKVFGRLKARSTTQIFGTMNNFT